MSHRAAALRSRLKAPLRIGSAASAVRAAARAAGYDVVRRDYYSAVPDPASLPPEIWTRERPLLGLWFNVDAGLSFVNRELSEELRLFQPLTVPPQDYGEYWTENDLFGAIDAAMLFAMMRRYQPSQVLELGSGMSSLVIAHARAGRPSSDGRYTIFDPFPRSELKHAFRKAADIEEIGATDVPLSRFAELKSGDLLFVDTTHTVKIGGDVDRIILEALPVLAPGVFVHFHDIYLPWEYPRELVVERRFYWAEQYLLQAFLAFNDEFQVLFSTHALSRSHPSQLAELVPNARGGARPASIWLRRRTD